MATKSAVVLHRDWLLPLLDFFTRWPKLAALTLRYLMPFEFIDCGGKRLIRHNTRELDGPSLRHFCIWLSELSLQLEQRGSTDYFCSLCQHLHPFGEGCPVFVGEYEAAVMTGITIQCLRTLLMAGQIRGSRKVNGQWFIRKENAGEGLANLTVGGPGVALHAAPLPGAK